jgi:heptose I phosphotransferase
MTETLWRRFFRGVLRVWQRPDWAQFAGAEWVDRILSVTVTDNFHAKQGKSTGRWILSAGQQRLAVYLKRHYRLPWWRGLLATAWPAAGWSPALSEWRHLRWARSQRMPVPEPVAAGEFIGPWGRLRSFLVVEELTGMLPLHEAIPAAAACLTADVFRQWKRALVKEVARLTLRLHGQRRYHKDLYLCHFYISRADTERLPPWSGPVHLIDLHRLQRHTWAWPLWQAKDLAQLLYSSDIEGVDARDRLRFWHAYIGVGWRRAAWWLRWSILIKWHLYQRHNRKKRAAANARRETAG